jgi:hypothetical protein
LQRSNFSESRCRNRKQPEELRGVVKERP